MLTKELKYNSGKLVRSRDFIYSSDGKLKQYNQMVYNQKISELDYVMHYNLTNNKVFCEYVAIDTSNNEVAYCKNIMSNDKLIKIYLSFDQDYYQFDFYNTDNVIIGSILINSFKGGCSSRFFKYVYYPDNKIREEFSYFDVSFEP